MIEHDLEKDIYIILFEGYLETNKILEKDYLLELETIIQNTCKISFHINIDENLIFFHGYGNNILNFDKNQERANNFYQSLDDTKDSNFEEILIIAVRIIKNILDITIKYGEICITECKEDEKSFISSKNEENENSEHFPLYKQYILHP